MDKIMKLFFAVLLTMPLFGLAQKAPEARFVINGRVGGLPDSTGVCVTDVSNPTDTLCYAVIKGGVFVLVGHVSEPNLYEVNFLAAKKKIPLFLGNDKISMSGTIEDLKGITVTGSPSNDDFMEFQSTFNPYFTRLNTVTGLVHSPAGANKQDS